MILAAVMLSASILRAQECGARRSHNEAGNDTIEPTIAIHEIGRE